MNRSRAAALLLVLSTTLALGACGSSRFGGPGPRSASAAPRPTTAYNVPDPAPVEAVPSGSVQSAPLAPPPGAVGASPDSGFGTGPIMADVPPTAPTAPTGGQQVATLAPPPAAAPSPSRAAMVGGWTARDASGSSCRVQLSSSPALDLYRASAAGCANKDLSRVTAWDFRDGEVYLYQPGGAVAARLRAGGGSLDGVLAKSGAPLTLAR
jgi:hypothetical protein